jgi:hypothetical protein
MPPWWSPVLWAARAFNGVIWLRNWLVDPPFIMYYLTFMLPGVTRLLRRHGLSVEVLDLGLEGMWSGVRLVIATRPGEGQRTSGLGSEPGG